MYKILIVEDNQKIRDELAIFLSRNGYQCQAPEQFDDIVSTVAAEKPHLVLLDINLPVFDGYYICREIRKRTDVPIIVVTSRNSEIDELMAMNLGADDFVTKPYNTQILLMRIASILKRAFKDTEQIEPVSTFELGQYTVIPARSALIQGDQEISLTRNELKILTFLNDHRGSIVSRDDLMLQLWNSDIFVDDNTLTVNINRLRKKLDEAGLPDRIETRRNQGYLLK